MFIEKTLDFQAPPLKDHVNEVNKQSIVVNLAVVVIIFIEKTLNFQAVPPSHHSIRCSEH